MISTNLQENKQNIKDLFNNSSDLIIYEFTTNCNDKAFVFYIQGIIDKEILNEDLLKPLINDLEDLKEIKSKVYISPTIEVTALKDCIIPIINGDVALFIENSNVIHLFTIEKWNKRQIEQATSEMVIRGPKQAFVEDIEVNKTLIRRIIKNNNLVFEDYILGVQTNTTVSLVYLKNIVKQEVLEEIRGRIKDIETGDILGGGYIESFITDKPKIIISTVSHSEKPDVITSKILEGNIAILSDGSPDVLSVPKLFIENLHSPEDYYLKPTFATFLRILRLISFFISFTLPGIYISIALYHQEMIPTNLLISIAGQREGVPLSSAFEALLMIGFFEILKESGIRLPKAIGQAVTLVGGLVIGQAAVDAGVISATLVIIVAATGMAEFVVPKLREMTTVYRIAFLLLGSVAGLYGVTFGLVFLVVQLVSTKSFGVPFMWPFVPYDKEGIKDAIIKYPVEKLEFRPEVIAKEGSLRRSRDN